MGYTPVELRHVNVRRRLFGYDRGSVQQILDEVAESFETVWRDRGELADRVEALELETDELKQREQALLNTLVAAERVADEVRGHAQREAGVIVAEARSEALEIMRGAEIERERLRVEVRRIEALLRSALGVIDEAAMIAVPVTREAEAGEPVLEAQPETARDAAAGPAAPGPAPTPAQASDPAADAPAEAAVENEPELDTPGWPPLREVAQGSTRFDWGS